MRVASGILSIWHATAVQAAEGFDALDRAHPGRFLLGLGASHALRVDVDEKRYERPWSRMVGYLDELDAQRPGVPPGRRVLAALGPRMLLASPALGICHTACDCSRGAARRKGVPRC